MGFGDGSSLFFIGISELNIGFLLPFDLKEEATEEEQIWKGKCLANF